MCMIDDVDYCELYRKEVRKAKKHYKCGECHREITTGEKYLYSSMLFDGAFDYYRTCQHCMKAAEWLVTECNGWVHYGLLQDLEDHWDEGYRVNRLGRLIIGIRNKWNKLRGAGLLPVPDMIAKAV